MHASDVREYEEMKANERLPKPRGRPPKKDSDRMRLINRLALSLSYHVKRDHQGRVEKIADALAGLSSNPPENLDRSYLEGLTSK